MTIGTRIKQLRESRGLTQAALADIVGVSDKAVSTWENNAYTPRMGVIQKLASYFNVSKAYLIGESDAPSDVPASLQPNPVSLTPDETNLLDNYRMLNTEGKSIARTTVQSLAANPDLRKDTSSETA